MDSSNPRINAEDHEQEATELREHSADAQAVSNLPEQASHGVSPYTGVVKKIQKPLSSFWKHQVSAAVPHVACRDHLGTYNL